MIIYARELSNKDEPFLFISDNGMCIVEEEILSWLVEHFGEPGNRWTYYYLIDYFEYPDFDYPFMIAHAADVAWDFSKDDDACLFKMTWG